MKIGIDARSLSKQRTGVGNYLINILKCIEKIDQDHEFFLYSNSYFDLPFENSRWHKRICKGLCAKVGTLWLLTEGRKNILKDGINLFWGAQEVVPFRLPIRKVVTIFDLVWFCYPNTMSSYNLLVHKMLVKKSISDADVVLAISKSTINDLNKVFNVSPNDVVLTYCAAGHLFHPIDKYVSANYIAKKYGVSEKYILNVGTIEPRKNIITLLKAFRQLIDKYGVSHQLLIAGAKGWKNSDIYLEYKKLRFNDNEIKFLGYVPDEDLPKLYSGAEVFIYPSIYEGFGLPPIEAMACGCPVITSNVSSLPEIVSDAGIMVNPYETDEISKVIYEVLTNKELKIKLRQKGIERAKFFSWEKTARLILKSFTSKP